MPYTPVELRHVRLGRSLFGYKRATSSSLLEDVADSFEDVWRERGELTDRVEDVEKRLGEFKDREQLLASTLVAAEKAAAKRRMPREREAELIVAEAHGEARSITAHRAERARAAVRRGAARRGAAARGARHGRGIEGRAARRGCSAGGPREAVAGARGHERIRGDPVSGRGCRGPRGGAGAARGADRPSIEQPIDPEPTDETGAEDRVALPPVSQEEDGPGPPTRSDRGIDHLGWCT